MARNQPFSQFGQQSTSTEEEWSSKIFTQNRGCFLGHGVFSNGKKPIMFSIWSTIKQQTMKCPVKMFSNAHKPCFFSHCCVPSLFSYFEITQTLCIYVTQSSIQTISLPYSRCGLMVRNRQLSQFGQHRQMNNPDQIISVRLIV